MTQEEIEDAAENMTWEAWVASRPKVIQDMVAKLELKPGQWYTNKPTGQIGFITGLNEGGTVSATLFHLRAGATINARGPLDLIELASAVGVFGIDPNDLEKFMKPLKERA